MFWLTMGYETHPNDSQQVFVDLFLYTTVVKWTRKNKNVFVYVKCFYVTVSLTGCLTGPLTLSSPLISLLTLSSSLKQPAYPKQPA